MVQETAHKHFVKAPGQKNQQRVTEFASQVANHYYSMLVTTKALRSVDTYDKSITTANKGMQQCTYATNDDVNNDNDIKFELSGKYSLRITENVTEKAGRGEDIYGKTTQIPSVSVFCNPRTVDLTCTFQEQLIVVEDRFLAFRNKNSISQAAQKKLYSKEQHKTILVVSLTSQNWPI